MELRKGLKVMKRKTVISLIIATILVVSLITAIVFTQSEKMMLLKEAKQELKRAMNYDEFEEGEENVEGTDNVKFSAFFLRDLNADGYAEKIKGTCKPIGSEDTLYMELNVLTAGYLKDAKVEINGKNFYLQTALPKDNELKNNYIGNNIKIIEFNNIVNGTQKLFSGIVRSGDYSYSTGKTAAIGNNIANYSREDNTITFSGTYVAEDGTETRIVKIIPIIMDWYGTTNATIGSTTQNHYDIDNRIDEENNSLVLDFTVNVSETQNKLILSKNYVEGEIPELNGFAPTYVGLENSQGLTFNYDEETRRFTIEKLATLNENLVTKTVARSSSYKFQVVYPYEAYEDNFGDTITLKIPVRTYFEGYNNPNTEFENPYVSNTAKGTIVVKFNGEITKDSRISIEVGKYVSSPYRRNIVSKQKPLNIYNGISEEEDEDFYEVKWNVYVSSKNVNDKMILREKIESENFVSDNFIKNDSSKISIKDISKNVGIYFYNADKFLGKDGYINVYDAETNILIKSFNSNEWSKYNKDLPYRYEFPISHIRIETSEVIEEEDITIVHVKEINDNVLTKTYDISGFEEFEYVESNFILEIDGEEKASVFGLAKYEVPSSFADLIISKDVFSTQVTERDVELTISVEEDEQNNLLGWKDGVFLLKFPKEIIDLEIIECEIDNEDVYIDTYEIVEIEDCIGIKLNTVNDIEYETSFKVNIKVNITPDPRISTTVGDVELYAYNSINSDYFYKKTDIYDINNNLNVNENVNYVVKIINLIAPGSILTNQIASEFDDEQTVVISPQIADVKPNYAMVDNEKKTVQIGVQIKNNYSGTISEVLVLGRIPSENNKTVLSDIDLESQFTTVMKSSGIEVPEELKDKVTIYYSNNINATKDLNNIDNNWILKEAVGDWDEIKSFMIDLKDIVLDSGREYIFSYIVEIPNDVSINTVSYSHHGIYFCLDTKEGKYRTQTEPNELGIRIAEKFDIEINKTHLGKNKVIPGATYIIGEFDYNFNLQKLQTAVTNLEGKILFKNLYAQKIYIMQEYKAPVDYELNDEELFLITDVNTSGDIFIQEFDGTTKDLVTVEKINNRDTVKINVEDEAKVQLKIRKVDEETGEPISFVKFKIFGPEFWPDGKIITTNKDGEACISGLSVGYDYEMIEVQADGYYLSDVIEFCIENNDGIYEIDAFGESVREVFITENDSLPILNLEIENEKIHSCGFEIVKTGKIIEKNLETEEENVRYLENAKFKLYRNDEEIGTYVTDQNGKIFIEKLYLKDSYNDDYIYTLREVGVPEGYTKVSDVHFRIVREDNQFKFVSIDGKDYKYETNEEMIILNIEDSPIFKIIKTDKETGKPLEGIKFAIFDVENGNVPAINSKGEIIGNKEIINGSEYYVVKTDKEGHIMLDLPEGIYKAVEVEAPEKYDISSGTYFFGVGKSVNGKEVNRTTSSISFGNNATVYDMEKTQDGGYIVVGSFSNELILNNEEKISSLGSSDAFVIKYNYNFEIEWHKIIAANLDEYLTEVVELSDGSYILAGDYNNRGNEITLDNNVVLGVRNNSYRNAMIVKYSIDGDIQWGKSIYGADSFACANKTQDGGVVWITHGNEQTLPNNQKVYDNAIVKMDTNGNISWYKSVDASLPNEIKGIIELNDGSFIAVGQIQDNSVHLGNGIYVSKASQYNGPKDGVYFKISSTGRTLWGKTIPAPGSEVDLFDVTATKDGGFVLIGQNLSGVNVGNGIYVSTSGSRDVLIVKYDTDGNAIWGENIGNNDGDELGSEIVALEDGGFMLTGFSKSSGIGLSNGQGIAAEDSIYGIVVKIDENGQDVWGTAIGGCNLSVFDDKKNMYSILVTDDEVYACGKYTNVYDIDFKKIESANIVKIQNSPVTSFENKIQFENSSLQVSNSIKTPDNGYIVLAKSTDSIVELEDRILELNEKTDIVIIKYNSLDRIEWVRTLGGVGDDTINSYTLDASGITISGQYKDSNIILSDRTELVNKGGNDAYIIKYSLNGDLLWADSISNQGTKEKIEKITSINDSGSVVLAYFEGPVQINNKEYTLNSNFDRLLIKYSDIGKIEWVKTVQIGSTTKMQKTKDGGFIIYGLYKSPTNINEYITLSSNNTDNAYIVKYDSTGNIEWYKNIGGNGRESQIYLEEISNGNLIVGINYESDEIRLDESNFVENKGSSDVLLIVYSPDGNILKYDNIATDKRDDINVISGTNDGGYIISYSFVGTNITIENINFRNRSDSGYSDAILIKYDQNNCIQWHAMIKGKRDEKIDTIIEKDNGGYFVNVVDSSTTTNIGYGLVSKDNYGSSTYNIVSYTKDGIPEAFQPMLTTTVYGFMEINNNIYFKTYYEFMKYSVVKEISEKQELKVENVIKEYKIITKVKSINGVKGGTISGEQDTYYELVKYNEDANKNIIMTPNEGYEIVKITINGQNQRFSVNDDGSYEMDALKNIKEDKIIEVTFSLETNKVTINKIDSETQDGIKDVKFSIEQIEERGELSDEIGEIVDNGQIYYEIDTSLVNDDCIGELVGNGQVYGSTADKSRIVSDVLGPLTNNGSYYFVNSDGKYIPNNKNINNGIAYSYIKIDLTNYSGNYVVAVNASVSSESGYDIGFARITDNTNAIVYNNTIGRFMYISGTVDAKDYDSETLTGGKVYYLHIGYRKDSSVNKNDDQVVINSINVHPCLEGIQYNFEKDGEKIKSSNAGVPNTVSNSYMTIDLTNKVGKYKVSVNAEISSQISNDMGYVTITESPNRPAYNNSTGRFLYFSGEYEAQDYQSAWLDGGKLYYLHFGYYKNSSTDGGEDVFTINSVNLYGSVETSYSFEKEGESYVSNNTGMGGTVANSYIPIDMTNLSGNYNIIVNAQVSSQINNDYGYVTVTTNENRPSYNASNGRFVYISGRVDATDYYSNKIVGGQMYYLHFGYYKNASTDRYDDKFIINSIKVIPNIEHLYSVEEITNHEGKIKTQLPYGKYVVTELNTPEGYEPLDSSVIIEFRENGEKEFTIENKKLAKVIVHHYKAEVDISKSGYIYTEEKLIDDEIFENKVGYPYKTSPKLDLGEYSLITDALGEYILPENATGQYNGVIEVSYYYSASKIPLRVQHIIEGTEDRVELATGEKSEDEISYGKQGESYETIPIPKDVLHEKYEVVDSSGNTSGTYEYTEEDIVVNYYYKIKEFDVTTGVKMKTQTDILGNESVVAGGTILGANEDVYETVLYGEDSTKDIVATPDEGYYVETLTVNDEPVTFTPDENGIVRLANFSNMREDKMVMVGFAQDKGKVTVHHKLQDVDEYVPSIEDGKTVEPEIKEGDIGKPFATKPSDKVALRYEAKSNTEPSSGVYTLEDQEVTYYYGYKDFEYKIEYYYNGVLDETKTENGIATWGTVIDSYTDKVEYGYELGEVENYPLTVSEYVENNIIKVNYEPKDTSLIVKYVDKHTGEEIAERKTVPGKMFEKHDLTEDIIDIEGYTFLEIPEPIIVDTSLEVQEYIIYYAANTKVTINYLDKADGKILETIIIEGKVDDPYEAYAKDFDKYVLDIKPENESGLMTREEIVLDYYYIYVSDGVIEKHIDLRTDKLLDSSYYTGMEGDPYTTDKKEFVGYDILTNKQYYKEFIKEQFTEDEILNLLKEYNLETEEELFEKHTEDLILKVLKEKGLNADDEYIPENKDGFMEKGVIEVKYYYVRKTKVIVEYIDKQTGKPVQVETKVDLDGDGVIDKVRVADAIEIIEGHEGDKYETIAKEFDGYTLQKDEEGKDIIPENANGEMTKEDIFVRYEYIKKAKVLEKHIDVKTGILIENVTVHEGYVGKEYDIKSKEFEKYHLVEDKLPTNSKGTMIDGDIVVEYYYIHEGKVIIEYLDKYSGEKLQEKVEKDLNEDLVIEESEFELVDSTIIIEGLEGDEYTSSAKEFEKYKLIESELPSNGSGTMTKENITVKYYYVKESVGIREEHRDSSTNELLEEPIIHPGYEGDSYKIDSKEFNNYDLDSDKLPNNSEGKMSKEEIVVTYYYKRKTEVIVKYVNEETGEELLEEVVIRGHVGDNYITEEKVIDGYTLVKITSNREGTMDKNVIVVTYYYVKAPEVIHKPDEPVVPEVPEVQEQPKEEVDHVVIGNTVTVNNQVVNTVTNTVITANTITNTTNTIISNTVKNEDYNKDKEIETPKTGDNTPIVLVIGCMVVLMLNTIYVLASTNKKQKPKNIIIVGKDRKKQK